MANSLKIRIDGDTKPFENSLKNIGNVAKKSMAVAVGATAAVGAALIAVTESTREYREEMNKLNTAFESAGKSTTIAKKAYEDLYGILGETDQAVEAASHLAVLANSEEEVAQWGDIAAGVLSKFGDSLPLEGLTEAASVTATLGEVTGPLTDAFEFAGITVDDFNDQLAELATKEERATLITETLNEIYGETGAIFRDTNKDIINSRLATEKLTQQLARVGEAFEPLMNIGKLNLASALDEMLTAFEEHGIVGFIESGLNIALEFLTSFGQTIADNMPMITQAIQDVITALGVFISENSGQILNIGFQILWAILTGIINAIPYLLEAAFNIVSSLILYFATYIAELLGIGVTIIANIFQGMMDSMQKMIDAAGTVINKVVEGINKGFKQVTDIGKDLVEGIWQGILNTGNWLKDKLSGWAGDVMSSIKGFFGIASPSKKMMVVGYELERGLGKGIEDNIDISTQAAENSASKVKAAFESSLGGLNSIIGNVSPSINLGGTGNGTDSVTNSTEITQNFYSETVSPFDAYRKVVGYAF